MPHGISGRTSLFVRIGDYAARKRGFVFTMTALLVFLAVSLGSRIRLDTDVLEMVPRGNVKVEAFKSSLKDFGSIDYLMVLIEAPEGKSAEEYHEFVDTFADGLKALPDVISVEYRLGANDQLLDLFRKYALLLLPPESLPDLERKLSDEGIRDAMIDNRRILASPAAALLKQLVREDPLGVGRLVFNRLIGGRQGLKLNPIDGYYMSEDSSALLMLVKPRKPAQDLSFTRRLFTHVDQVEARAREVVADEGLDIAGMKVEYGGTYMIGLVDSELIKGDLRLTAICSFLGVILVYLVGYRRFGALIYSSVPLLVGQALTFGLAAVVLGRLNAASSGFVAMLMGLGTDFTIIMYARYVEARQDGHDVERALRQMMGEAGLGVFTGAVTSAGTFYALTTTEFLGLRELGILIGSGMLFCLVSIFLLLPAMITWNEGGRRKRRGDATLHVQSFGLEKLIPIAVRNRKMTITLTIILTAWLGVEGWNVKFSDSVENLRNADNAGVLISEKVGRKFGGNLNVTMALIESTDVDDALIRMGKITEAARPFIDQGIIQGADSLLRYLPPASEQTAVIQALQAGASDPSGVFNIQRIEASMRKELEVQGFSAGAFDDYFPELEAMLDIKKPVGVELLQDGNLSDLLGRFIVKRGDVYKSAVYIFMDKARWKRNTPPGLVEAIAVADPAAVVTGVTVVSKELRTIFSRDSKKAVILGFVFVTTLLIIDLKSVKLAMLANVQVGMGLIMMFGLMSIAGIELNFVNSFTAIMVLGFGVDYGIHMIHRLITTGGNINQGVLETGKAVTMAALTNGAGFGALTLSSYPAMKSVGVVAILGSVCCLLAALTFLPAVMASRNAFDDAEPGAPENGPDAAGSAG
jgi:predicted RND superfamily exporter protein